VDPDAKENLIHSSAEIVASKMYIKVTAFLIFIRIHMLIAKSTDSNTSYI
jgi:hypothetical protein